MSDTQSFNDPRRLFSLWKELTGEDLLPAGADNSNQGNRGTKK
jgi:hypothetical protein